MNYPNRFARRVFLLAGTGGIVVLFPLYFLEARVGRDFPPPVTHPEYYYGFAGVALVWQFVFLLISSDVPRYRPLMLLAILEKLSFGVPALALYATSRAAGPVAVAGAADLVLGALFVAAYVSSRGATS